MEIEKIAAAMLIAGSVICSIVIFSKIGKYLSLKSRLKYAKDWKIDDVIYLKGDDDAYQLKGWNRDYFFVSKDRFTRRIFWNDLDVNKSHFWRENYANCERDMGVKPNFSAFVKYKNKDEVVFADVKDTYNGKSIDAMTEIECNVYLKECIENENYEIAEKIKKQLEKYR